ncbi:Ger(x)C family spore germination protein [Sutcliffiella horikoshii]|uniref:Ger(X)C family spore germination protein n=1 Tax=Sutcliffiella horikoshii TaxID=79883 RepID=A0A5D4SYT4_9BACI|nr:Ger(x)C family spore germination protein [Sutcliffiella horikoshii]TYS67468.1 Ger(x)C family spore germination protein [Sutcliffiella horikoshii]
MIVKKVIWLMAFLLMLSGCNDMREIDQRGMVLGISIDQGEEKKYKISIQLPILGKGQNGGSPAKSEEFEVLWSEGDTVWEALSNLESKTPNVLFFGHLKVIVISEKIAASSINGSLDLVDRIPDIGNKVFLLISKDEEASKFLETESSLVKLPALYVNQFFRADKKLARSQPVRVFQYRRDRNTVSSSAIIPIAQTIDSEIIIENMAVLKEDTLVEVLLGNEVAASQLIKGEKVEEMNYVTEIESKEKLVSVSLSRIMLESKVEFQKVSPITFDIQVSGEGNIVELSAGETSKDFIKKLEAKLNQDLKTDIIQTIEKMKNANAEPWLLGQKIWIKDQTLFDSLRWKEEGFKEAIFNVTVDFTIDTTGQKGLFNKSPIYQKSPRDAGE